MGISGYDIHKSFHVKVSNLQLCHSKSLAKMRAKIVSSLVFLFVFALCLASDEDDLESVESRESTDSEDVGEPPEDASESGESGDSIDPEPESESDAEEAESMDATSESEPDESRDAVTPNPEMFPNPEMSPESSGILSDAITYLGKVQFKSGTFVVFC